MRVYWVTKTNNNGGKLRKGRLYGVDLSLQVTQMEGKEDCCRWSYRQKDECGNKDRGVYSLIFWNSEDK